MRPRLLSLPCAPWWLTQVSPSTCLPKPPGHSLLVHEYLPYVLLPELLNECVAVRRPMIGLPASTYSAKYFICSSGRLRKRRKTIIRSADCRFSSPGMLLTLGLGLIVPSFASMGNSTVHLKP